MRIACWRTRQRFSPRELGRKRIGPTIALDEDDDFYLTLSNVGGFGHASRSLRRALRALARVAQAASIFDGLPDASIAVVPGASHYLLLQSK